MMSIKEKDLAKILFILDGAVLAITLLMAYLLRQNLLTWMYDPIQPWWVYVWLWVGGMSLFGVVGFLKGIYNWQLIFSRRQDGLMWRLWESVFIFGLLIMSSSYLVKYDFSRVVVVVWWLLSLVVLPIVRLWLNQWFKPRFNYHMLVVGKNRISRRFIRALNKELIIDIQVNQVNNLDQIKTYEWDEVVIVDPGLSKNKLFDWLSQQAGGNLRQVSLALDLFPKIFTDPQLHLSYANLPKLSFQNPGYLYKSTKRILDIVLSLFLLFIFSPVFIFIFFFIFLKTKTWPIIKLTRIGYRGEPLVIYKFKTMRGKPRSAKAPTNQKDDRIYVWGRFLRRTSLDELPQLFNILAGSMSLVGPRPEMSIEVKKYKPWQKIRLKVKPGLTGLWQVLGRKDLPLNQNLQYDLYYVANQNLWLDLHILVKTPWVVVTGKGAY